MKMRLDDPSYINAGFTDQPVSPPTPPFASSPSTSGSNTPTDEEANVEVPRPRVYVDRPVWTISECYQQGPNSFNLIPGFNDNNLSNTIQKEEKDQPQRSRLSGFSQSVKISAEDLKNNINRGLERRLNSSCCTREKLLRCVISIFPCIGWMRTYKIKEYLACDIISGITSAIFHVPQGMANALANAVAPVYGLYGSFFPCAVYSVMGTSMQSSVGTFTVVSLLTANAVRRLATPEKGVNEYPTHTSVLPSTHLEGITDNETSFLEAMNSTSYIGIDSNIITPIEVTVAVTFLSGIVQLCLGIIRLGRLGVLISPSLAGGFMTGCAVQIIASQLKGCFNLTFKDCPGIFNVINTLIAVFSHLGQANVITSIMSLCVCIALIIGKDFINPIFQRKLRIPLPVDLIMVILCSIVSYYLQLKEKYGVPIVNYIPKGLPSPVVPRANLLGAVIGDAVAVGLVGFAATFSMGTTFAKKYNHKVNANQELLALGCANIFGGFFLCLPGCGSLARSSVLESVGCKTQLTGMISCVFLALVLYFIGPLLQPLPKCVLATILATALKGYLAKILEVRKLWAVSKADAIIWLTTCFAVIILDVTYGLIMGVIITLLSVTWRMQAYRGTLLKEVKTSGIFLPNSKKKTKVNLSPDHGRLVLFRFGNPLCFATASNFESDIKRIINQLSNGGIQRQVKSYIIVDISSTCFIDNSGVEAIRESLTKCNQANLTFMLAAMPDNVVRTLQKSGMLKQVGYERIFPTIQDAVLACNALWNEEENIPREGNYEVQCSTSFNASSIEELKLEIDDLIANGSPLELEDDRLDHSGTDIMLPTSRRTSLARGGAERRLSLMPRRASVISFQNGQIIFKSYL